MKNGILKVLAVITAFLIGVTINNSCGNADSGGDMTLSQLQREIASLQSELNGLRSEVSSLKAEVESLKNGGGNGGDGNSDCGEFYVDGLYFNRNGNIITSKPKSSTSTDYKVEYQYDNQGRISKMIQYYNSGITFTNQYSYSGKKVTTTTTWEYDPEKFPNQENSTTTTTAEYY